jgi:hypothetical protein
MVSEIPIIKDSNLKANTTVFSNLFCRCSCQAWCLPVVAVIPVYIGLSIQVQWIFLPPFPSASLSRKILIHSRIVTFASIPLQDEIADHTHQKPLPYPIFYLDPVHLITYRMFF